jgi:membrane-bound metal-dependent hydrolase YbcI (DUF457 family)
VDPVTHLIIPLLVMLAARQNTRLVVMLSFFALLPDLDSIFGPHRMVLHNIFVIVLAPLAFLLYARLRKPELLLPGMIALFFLSSHLLLDLDGVAFLYPIDQTAYMFVPYLEFVTMPDFHFVFYVTWGAVELPEKYNYNMLNSTSIAFLLYSVMLCVMFREKVKRFWGKLKVKAKSFLSRLRPGPKKEQAS